MAITLTETAAEQVRSSLLSRGRGKGLRLAVKTTGCSGLAYVVEYADEVLTGDTVYTSLGIKVMIDVESLGYLEGTEIDFQSDGLSSSFKFKNPNAADECGCGERFTVA